MSAAAARSSFSGAPATVGAALTALFAAHPGLRDRIVGESGRLREHINVFVGGESVRYTGKQHPGRRRRRDHHPAGDQRRLRARATL